jgi:hypothetical protein
MEFYLGLSHDPAAKNGGGNFLLENRFIASMPEAYMSEINYL